MLFTCYRDRPELQEHIRFAAMSDLAIVELEYVGLTLRIINILEDNCKLIYLYELLSLTEEEVCSIPNVGKVGIRAIKNALEKLPELEKERLRWHKSSARVEKYQKKLIEINKYIVLVFTQLGVNDGKA